MDNEDVRGRVKADSVAAEIERAIVAREYPLGAVVGSEETLAQRFAVSRPIMREAFRILEGSGVASVRRGPGGGLVVGEPNADPVVSSAQRFLQYRGVSGSDLFRARLALERAAIEALIAVVDEEKIAVLREVLAWEESLGDALLDESGRGERLHLVIAELTGNAVFELFVPVLARLATRMVHVPHDERPERGSESRHAHAAIVDAIVRGDVGLAQHRLGSHLAALQHVAGGSATSEPIPSFGDPYRAPEDAGDPPQPQ